jgi:uncharacterized delta-60 repeat protein
MRPARRELILMSIRLGRMVAGAAVSMVLLAGLVPSAASAATSTRSVALASAASFTYPVPGALAVDTTKPFTWTAGAGAQGYVLTVGTALYGGDLVSSGVMPPGQLSRPVPTLPPGQTLYATLFTATNGAWTGSQSITFRAAPTPASFTYPVNGQSNVNTSQPFTWTSVPSAQGYFLTVGTTLYGTDLVSSGVMPPGQLSHPVPTLPAGRTVYATLFTATGGAWSGLRSISFTAAPGVASFTYPVPGQPNVDTTKSFTWTTVPGAQGYFLTVGTTLYGSDLVGSGVMPPSQLSRNVPVLPTGRTVYATLFTATNGAWTGQQSITFTAAMASVHGSVDASFGDSGQVTVDAAQSTPASLGFVAGTGQTLVGVNVFAANAIIERLSATGVIDTTFGTDGVVSLPAGMRIDQVLDGGNGKVLAIGVPAVASGAPEGTKLARFTATGVLDSGFGTGGVVTVAAVGPSISRRAVVATDGRIFVGAAVTAAASLSELGIAAFTSSGVVDTTFGMSGLAKTAVGGQVSGPVGLALQPDGRLVIASGVVVAANPSKAVVARFLATGQADTAFATNGVFAQQFGGTGDVFQTIAVAPSGDLVAAGVEFSASDGAGIIAELTSAGVLKTAFGSAGIVVENPTLHDDDIFEAVAVGAGNEIYGLLMEGSGPFNGSLRRYTSAGQPDTTFGSVGVVSLSGVIPVDMVLGSQGRPEIALEVPPASASVVAWRFLT